MINFCVIKFGIVLDEDNLEIIECKPVQLVHVGVKFVVIDFFPYKNSYKITLDLCTCNDLVTHNVDYLYNEINLIIL